MKFTNEELRILRAMTEAGDWPISGRSLKPLLARLSAAEKVVHLAYQGLGGHVLKDAIMAWVRLTDEESD